MYNRRRSGRGGNMHSERDPHMIKQTFNSETITQTPDTEGSGEQAAVTSFTPHERNSTFEKDLAHVINRHSRENGSNTPDFILAAYLADCLENFNRITSWRG